MEVRRRALSRKGLFAKDLTPMLYAFGDVNHPRQDTINVLEDMVIEFISNMCRDASIMASERARRHKVKVDDFKFLLRPNHARDGGKKLGRVEELLYMQEVIKRARQQFDTKEEDFVAAAGTIAGENSRKKSNKGVKRDHEVDSIDPSLTPNRKRANTTTTNVSAISIGRELSEDDDYDED